MQTVSLVRRPEEKQWWDDIPDPVRIEIKPTEEQAAELAKSQKVRQGCGLIFFGILIRIYGFLMGVLMLGYAGWIFYMTSTNLLPLPILANVAMGGFLLIAGLLTILAETRTRRTMERCLSTYIILSNHLARGLFYIVVGGLTFPINVAVPYIGEFGDSRIFAGFIVAAGFFNLVYSPFRFRYLRRKELASQTRGIAFAEEIAYEMNITHISQVKAPPVSEPQPVQPQADPIQTALEIEAAIQMHEDDTNGANCDFVEIDLSASKGKQKEKDIFKSKDKNKEYSNNGAGASTGMIAPAAGVPVF